MGDNAGRDGLQFGLDFFRLDLHQGLTLTDGTPLLFQPANDSAVLHFHTPLGQDNFHGHIRISYSIVTLAASAMDSAVA